MLRMDISSDDGGLEDGEDDNEDVRSKIAKT